MHSSKKRPSPLSDTNSARANYSDSNIASPHIPRSAERGMGRPRSFLHDPSVNISKRSSLSESTSFTPQSFEEQDLSYQNIWNLGTASGIMTPTSGVTPFSSQHLGNPNLPDMKPVMFPSDNPFAYPNQPMSTLEARQILKLEQSSSYSSPTSTSLYNIGVDNNQAPASLSFDNPEMPAFPESFNMPLHFMQQGGQISTSMVSAPAFDATPQIDEPAGLDAINFPGGEGYWSQIDRTGGGRTGLTPGGINLDELFGGEGWSNIWNTQSFAR